MNIICSFCARLLQGKCEIEISKLHLKKISRLCKLIPPQIVQRQYDSPMEATTVKAV